MISNAEILQGLNSAQREAVEAVTGPILVVAGPGSGKTRVITHRIGYLLRTQGVSPYRIVAVTFTNKAAREMRSRLQRLVGPSSYSLTVGTFHAFCAGLLRRDGAPIGLGPNYTIFDDEDQLALIKQAMERTSIDPKQFPPRTMQGIISRAKSVLLDSRALSRSAQNFLEERGARVYQEYEELLGRNHAVDFDDLLMKAVQLLQEFPQLRQQYQQRYMHLMVDEFQDTNVAQYRLAQILAAEHRNFCVVGDPDQSIYSWRNADIRNILSFQKDYPDARTIVLGQNYRSTRTILEVAQHLISSNGMRLQKKLFTENGQGVPVMVHEAYNQEEEAEFVVSEVDRLVRAERIKLGSFAAMYRVNAQSRALEEACLRRGIKYRLVGGVRFYQRQEVKDLLSYLRLLQNPVDEVSLGRIIGVPPRGVGSKSLQDLVAWAQRQNMPLIEAMRQIATAQGEGRPSPAPLMNRAAIAFANLATLIDRLLQRSSQVRLLDLIDELLEETRLRQHIQASDDRPEERWENILELRQIAQGFNAEEPPNGLISFLERVSLIADVDSYEESEDSMTLITLHQAKGLEFPVVFILGMEEGLLPHSRSMESEKELEEERRLCYVGITRAQKRLYLLRAFRRGFRGASSPTAASRFLKDIPAQLLQSPHQARGMGTPGAGINATPWAAEGTSAPTAPAPLNVQAGDLVRHLTFGEGVVVSCVGTRDDHEVTVQFKGGVGAKRLLLSYAPLQKIEQ